MSNIVFVSKKLTLNFFNSIINDFNFVFNIEQKQVKDFHLDLSNIEEVDLAGMLLLFKFIEYSVTKKCFLSPNLYGGDEGQIAEATTSYGFDKLFKDYIKNPDNDTELKKLKIIEKDSFLIAPHALLRGKHKTKKDFDRNIEKALNDFYGIQSTSLVSTILNCAAEISSNFYNHAENDSKTIILAKGTKNHFEIACIDTSEGIPSTLKSLEKYNNKLNSELLELALQREVTSKPDSSHMGYGLWVIKEVVKMYDGLLDVYTENVRYRLKYKNEKISKCPYWKGTFVYLKIPIKYGLDIATILKEKRKVNYLDIKINFN